MNLYTCTSIDLFISEYIERGGNAYQISDGVLTSGNWVLYDITGKLKCYVIKDVYLNEWSSAQSFRKYNKIPKKYMAMIHGI